MPFFMIEEKKEDPKMNARQETDALYRRFATLDRELHTRLMKHEFMPRLLSGRFRGAEGFEELVGIRTYIERARDLAHLMIAEIQRLKKSALPESTVWAHLDKLETDITMFLHVTAKQYSDAGDRMVILLNGIAGKRLFVDQHGDIDDYDEDDEDEGDDEDDDDDEDEGEGEDELYIDVPRLCDTVKKVAAASAIVDVFNKTGLKADYRDILDAVKEQLETTDK